jgi:V8-like Glu-specific endopeptidase
MRYEFQANNDTRYAMGTGWLIRPNLLVTAGHCAFDWSQRNGKGFGRAIEVKAYIGYNGKDSINSPNVEFRHGHRIVTTQGWLKSGENRQNDVSFIELDSAFTNLVPLKFSQTPVKGGEFLGVVGYPGDMKLKGERGAQMYEEYKQVTWNISNAVDNMLEYQINTYKGKTLDK